MCTSTSSIMDFYKAERSRVLWLREQNSAADTIRATAEAMECEAMNNENASYEAYTINVQPRSGWKRPSQADLPFQISNGKRAKIF